MHTTRAHDLRLKAGYFRALTRSFSEQDLRDQALDLAARCELLAREIEQRQQAALTRARKRA
jgi:hypothetical protein